METNINKAHGTATLALNGRFDMAAIGTFRNAYRILLTDGEVRELVIDFSQTPFIDSSAMGMLLLLREQAEAVSKTVVLANCSSRIQQVFSLAQFNRLFVIR